MIGIVTENYFRQQFMEENLAKDYSMLEVIPRLITIDQNQHMTRPPTQEKVKKVALR